MNLIARALLLMLCISVAFSTSSYGQKCTTSKKRAELLQNNPQLAYGLALRERATQQWIAENLDQVRTRSVVTLPLVVHVVWYEEEENISEAQIQSQLDVLNEDFRKLNTNFSDGPMPFQALAADIEIEFCLASFDPDGNPTNGITRRETFIEGIGGSDDLYYDDYGDIATWDPDRYINIWVCQMGEDDGLGFAYIPGTADPPETDGIVIGHQYFGTVGTAADTEDYNLGRTATHEMGHYFNLEHVWGPEDGGCNEDDFVADTPPQFTESEGCLSFPSYDDCTDSGNGIMFNNYMDYSDDRCATMFTQGQKMRMLAALNGPRSSLLSSNACGLLTSVEDELAKANINLYPNPAQNRLFISDQVAGEIYDAMGKKMLTFDNNQGIGIDITRLTSGVYFVRFQDKRLAPQKFLVVK
ncbi:MAG: M43 family zinc metalloprotease [Bacteroidota bacterium]